MKISTSTGTIAGDSKDPAHPAWIELLSYDVQMSKEPAAAGQSAKATRFGLTPAQGQSSVTPTTGGSLTGTKPPDKSSPLLLEAMQKGAHLPQVVIESYRNGKLAGHVTLSDVLITRFQRVSPQQENLTLNFSKIVMN